MTIRQEKLMGEKQKVRDVAEEARCYHKTNPEEKSEDFLMNKACREIGLYDWGDTSFVAPLRRLLNSFREEET